MAEAMHFEGFAQRLLQLLDEGRFVATYKFAVLLGLLDVLAENVDRKGRAPTTISTSDLARAVLEMYWPHTTPYSGTGATLRQNTGTQAEILRLIGDFREHTVRDATAPLSRALVQAPEEFERLVRSVERVLIKMPLGKLQRIGAEHDPFIYTLELAGRELRLLPGAGDHLLRAAPLLRPLVQRSWTLQVARINQLPEAELEDFLFGTQRIPLAPLKAGLCELAAGRCFYCRRPVVGKDAIDHFLPWSRHIDNGIENLVYAHASCNGDKREYLAATGHVERWVTRMSHPALVEFATAKKWESHPSQTLAVARSIYLRLPQDYKLWEIEKRFSPTDPVRVAGALAGA
jgi:5-methylcytosine-specific restriction endonuclease McrA